MTKEKKQYSLRELDGRGQILDPSGKVLIEGPDLTSAEEEFRALLGPDADLVKPKEGDEDDKTAPEDSAPPDDVEPDTATKPDETEPDEAQVPQKALHAERKKRQDRDDLLTKVSDRLSILDRLESRLAALESRKTDVEDAPPDPLAGREEDDFLTVKDVRSILEEQRGTQESRDLDLRLMQYGASSQTSEDVVPPAQAVEIMQQAFKTNPELRQRLAREKDPITVVRQAARLYTGLAAMLAAGQGQVGQADKAQPDLDKAATDRRKVALDAKTTVHPSLGKRGEGGVIVEKLQVHIDKLNTMDPTTQEYRDYWASLPMKDRREILSRFTQLAEAQK